MDGFGPVLNNDGTHSCVCEKCPQDCLECGGDSKKCTKCKDEFGFVISSDGRYSLKCDECKDKLYQW